MRKHKVIKEPIGIYDARSSFSELIDQVASTGESIMITKHGKPVAELVPPRMSQAQPRKPGLARSRKFFMVDDFDAPLNDFSSYSS